MKAVRQVWGSLMAMLLVVAAMPASADSDSLRQYVDDNTQALVQELNEKRGLYNSDREAFYEQMESALSNFVDFRRIAARVMGRYARQASPEQRDAFVEKFKRSLFDSYAKALVEADNFTISVGDATINPNNDERASVELQVTTASGNRYPVVYSMYLNDNDRWMMENVIVEGVNIGLAFRDRFTQEMEENRNNVQAVIDGWTDTVKELDLDKKVDQS
ncbi:ABC transporter substrate-binding protein [Marinobacter sp. R17]|uniref:MlaC/ttg2D family ABC transporter substrate-binding protein n=1 Tax=Marinobacter sp. R17 TaxID=2484250 RepID=UPI000F4B7B46|nr:ABC transporter substrate-binding protein [Marinobacter sp. R17]ROU01953.1 ABC transporter substrate-binding protein [Marinobacter sp. R17]